MQSREIATLRMCNAAYSILLLENLHTLSMVGLVVDRHVLAWISIAGVVFDVMGGLYLAYDLLGGQHGPLRTLTRAVTYGLYFSIVYGIPFGLPFGLVTGVGLGLLLGLEFAGITPTNMDKGTGPAVSLSMLLFGALRGAVLGIAGALSFGATFGIVFGVLSAVGIVLVYRLRFSPAVDYDITVRPRLRWHVIEASVMRGIAIGCAAIIAGILARGSGGVLLGIEIGVMITLAGAVLSTVSPFVEWWADHLPARRLGAFGAMLLLIGLALSSLQYWLVIFDVPIH